MRKKRMHAWGAILMTALLTISGCDSNTATVTKQQETTGTSAEVGGSITFITNRQEMVDSGMMDRYIEGFKKKYPAVTDVKVSVMKNYDTDIRIKILTNDYGDVLLLPGDLEDKNLPEYFEPIDDLGLTDKLYYNNRKTFEDKHYAATVGVSALGLVYNKTAFEKAGIKEFPATLTAFYEACEKLKQAGIIPVYVNYASGWTLPQWGVNMAPVIQGDAKALNFMTTSDSPFQEDNPVGQSYGIIRHLIQKGYTESDLYTNHWEESKKELAEGKAAMMYLGNWVIPQILSTSGTNVKSEDIGFMPFPASDSGKLSALMSSDAWFVINKNSKNMKTAKAWFKYLLEESDYADDNGFIPTVKTREPSLPQLKEFLAAKPALMENIELDSDFYTIASKAGFDLWSGDIVQKLAVAKNLQGEFDQWNDKWRQARQEIQP
ncbi:Multiple sugar-binding protein precursor [compost metagenome]